MHKSHPFHQAARRLLLLRRARSRYLPKEVMSGPPWDLLLALFATDHEIGKLTLSSLSRRAGTSATTTLRWVERLEEAGLVDRFPSSTDRRIVFVELNDTGRDAVHSCFEHAQQAS